MADTIWFTEGLNEILQNGLPTTVYFALSTKSVDATSPHTAGETLAGAAFGEITGTGYARLSEAEPTVTGGAAVFAVKSWATGAATDWTATARSWVAMTGAAGTGKLLCARNLVSGGAARDLSGANTTENVTPTISVAGA